MREVYLDNAATARYRPAAVLKAVNYYLSEIGCNPGRGGYECSLQAGRIILEARTILAEFFNVATPEQIIFTPNITYALNTAIKGLVEEGDHVITTTMDHNSVLRPLKRMTEQKGIEVDFVEADNRGMIDVRDLQKLINNKTKVIVTTHASNVTGTLLPVEKIGRLAGENDIFFILDTAQTAGVYDIDFSHIQPDVLCFTGHKYLMGPPGTGGFAITKEAALRMQPLIEGGTGSVSDKEYQPEFLPDKFESGTGNTAGLAGLKAGVEYINNIGREKIKSHINNLTVKFLAGLQSFTGINIYGPPDINLRTATISISIDSFDMGELSYLLADKYNIMTRPGLHCAPLAHRSIGTFPGGTVRFSIGYFNNVREIEYTLDCLGEIIQKT